MIDAFPYQRHFQFHSGTYAKSLEDSPVAPGKGVFSLNE